MADSIKPWQRQSSKQLVDCKIFTVNESVSISPETAKAHNFYFINSTDWVNLVPVTANNELVCIRQYRHGFENITLEIPGGMVDPGESPAIAAVRECLEETGYEATEVESLGVLNPNPAIFNNRLHTYIARDVHCVADINNTSTEHTEVELIPLPVVKDKLMAGEINHALVAASLWRALYLLQT
ncbi:MAG: NUDIX hydrolase [Pseudomonadales bacterium]|nr:NUDIX hydrolase [Pseudomonadales bacterium]